MHRNPYVYNHTIQIYKSRLYSCYYLYVLLMKTKQHRFRCYSTLSRPKRKSLIISNKEFYTTVNHLVLTEAIYFLKNNNLWVILFQFIDLHFHDSLVPWPIYRGVLYQANMADDCKTKHGLSKYFQVLGPIVSRSNDVIMFFTYFNCPQYWIL